MTHSVMTDLLAYNCNLNTAEFYSFMHDLAREGDILSAEVLLDTGNAIDQPDELGRRPLHEAAFYGHLDMVKFLLGNGALLDAPIHPFGHTALTLAVQQSRYNIVRYLVEKGARLSVEDALFGTGLLHVAASKGDMKMAGILISSGIDVFQSDKNGRTARDIASSQGHDSLADVLLKVMTHHARYAA